jgi:hypothetical protein
MKRSTKKKKAILSDFLTPNSLMPIGISEDFRK